jgi:hypothetical protein
MKAKKKIAIDMSSISSLTIGGHKIAPMEIINEMVRTGILLYDGKRGNAPVLLDANADIKLFDSNSEEGRKFMEDFAKHLKE